MCSRSPDQHFEWKIWVRNATLDIFFLFRVAQTPQIPPPPAPKDQIPPPMALRNLSCFLVNRIGYFYVVPRAEVCL